MSELAVQIILVVCLASILLGIWGVKTLCVYLKQHYYQNICKQYNLAAPHMHIGHIRYLESEIDAWKARMKTDNDKRYQQLIDDHQKIIDEYNNKYASKKYRLHFCASITEILHSTNFETKGLLYCDSIEECVEFIKKIVDFNFLKNCPNIEDDLHKQGLYPCGGQYSYTGCRFSLQNATVCPQKEEYLYFLRS